MAQNPIGTVTDEERLVVLFTDEDGFRVDVTDPVETADVPEEGWVAWRLLVEGDLPRLAFAPVADPDDAGDLPARRLSSTEGARTIEMPEPLIADGLGLDADAYDDDNPLLFKPNERPEGVAVGMTADGEPGGDAPGAIELVPVRFADGTPYRDEPIDEDLDSDPVAEAEIARDRGEAAAPRSESISAPVDAAVVDDVLETTDASRAEVVRALETISRQDVVTEADDDTTQDPLSIDERAVVGLDDESWAEQVAPQLDVDDAALEAVREIHARQADVLVERSGITGERFEGRTPVVIGRDRR